MFRLHKHSDAEVNERERGDLCSYLRQAPGFPEKKATARPVTQSSSVRVCVCVRGGVCVWVAVCVCVCVPQSSSEKRPELKTEISKPRTGHQKKYAIVKYAPI